MDKKNKWKLIFPTTGLLATFALATILGFSPGLIFHPEHKETKKPHTPVITKSYGPEINLVPPEPPQPKRDIPKTFDMPFTPPSMDRFYDRIPTTPPVMEPPKPKPIEPPKQDTTYLDVYAKHAELTERMSAGLSSKFKLDKMSPAPTSPAEQRFNTAYIITDDGESIERLDLMSIVKKENMKAIKTAKDALKALVEESSDVNIIESDDTSLYYDISGSRGYQIGKIVVDDKGVYILGYVNLTTNRMPKFLKDEWLGRLKNI